MSLQFVDIHTHNPQEGVISVLSCEADSLPKDSKTKFSCGIHPWNLLNNSLGFTTNPNLIAIGEIGLDYAIKNPDKNLQQSTFISQLKLAQQLDLPVIIHCVRAYDDLLKILADYPLRAVIFHGFVGSKELIHRLLLRGYYISYNSRSLKSSKTIEALKTTPLDKLFLESDTSLGTIEQTYRLTAELVGITLEELKKQIHNNFNTIFGNL